MSNKRWTFWDDLWDFIGREVASHAPIAILAAVLGLLVLVLVPIAYLLKP